MKIHLAEHFGMCFGVRDAIEATGKLAGERSGEVTVLGELVHNPVVESNLKNRGVRTADLNDSNSAETDAVVFTAHGVSDRVRKEWAATGRDIVDTTCPLVKKAHRSLECLVLAGYHPVVIGKRDHAEVLGLTGDFPDADVILSKQDIAELPDHLSKIGIISQTTQPVERVQDLVRQIESRFPAADVRFIDTVCRPTKNRQVAMINLCQRCDTIVVVGGRNSNNTRQLVMTAEARGCQAFHIEQADDLRRNWFANSQEIGVTAGTSTLNETVMKVVESLKKLAASEKPAPTLLEHNTSLLK